MDWFERILYSIICEIFVLILSDWLLHFCARIEWLKNNFYSNSNTISIVVFSSLYFTRSCWFSFQLHVNTCLTKIIDIFLFNDLHHFVQSISSFLISLFSSCCQLVSILFQSREKSNVVMHRKFIFDWKKPRRNKKKMFADAYSK